MNFIVSAKQLAASRPTTRSQMAAAPWTTVVKLLPIVVTPFIASEPHKLGYFVQYEMRLQCPITLRSWTIYKRYSQLLQFRSQLAKLHATSPSCFLAYLLNLHFPKKMLNWERPVVVADRMQRFQIFVEHIWSLYVSCVVPMTEASEDVDAIISCLRAFLSVPETVLAISVRHLEDMPRDLDACVVCLGEFAAKDFCRPSTVLALACGHVFHQDCLRQWFVLAATCPTCRCDAGQMSLLEM
ncbi:hypothetical protein SDRG_12992 [Saprolegnia diclina VS20]|uniref:RING-type domain-containing protein n=1 Tax=Saprolegnia diclina (strain VS20) TaxID=1156394 RepID=T0RAU7_SAPDV|nr:hypothetical protein SDRG_12992 [Saprolegnia diclina VS20]EQC29323.1 hypothetical protein SDRG_12992 [Saprolegnia diclina VS20]|eukprot:XP_008617297.1 hypothetical protein SDRG_12992 [Saprolegnia diclina VS20]